MKNILGIFTLLLIVFAIVSAILALWGIHIIPWNLAGRVILSIVIVLSGVLFLWLAGSLFFGRKRHRREGANAHPME